MSKVETKENSSESSTGENYIHEAGRIKKGLDTTEDEAKNSEEQASAENIPHKQESNVLNDIQSKLEMPEEEHGRGGGAEEEEEGVEAQALKG
jgi:hypothetical protein